MPFQKQLRHAPGLAAILWLSAVSACGGDTVVTPDPVPAATITISTLNGAVYERDDVQFTAVYRDGAGTVVPGKTIEWSVNDATRAEVYANGSLFAMKAGAVRLTARSGDISATQEFTIIRPAVTSVDVLLPNPMFSRGDVVTMGVRANGPGGRVILGRTVAITSDNPAIATVDASGRIRGVSAGVATIRATADGVAGTAQVTVRSDDAELEVTHYNGVRLPARLATDTIRVEGKPEVREVWFESGSLVMSGTPLRYQLKFKYFEYIVRIVDGRRVLEEYGPQGESDRGTVSYDTRGDFRFDSDLNYPVSFTGASVGNNILLRWRVPGDNEIWDLTLRRVVN
ncbi:MAG: Ig-like domain-containing protein [Gemmatimonas sp.]